MWESQVISGITGFKSTSDDPRFQPDPVVLAGIAATLRGFWRRPANWGMPDDVTRTLANHLTSCLRELDALPRDDPFWDGTDRRPTEGRIREFCAGLLGDDPADSNALRMAAAYRFVIGQSSYPPTWRGLLKAGVWDLSWPVYAALNGYDGGCDTVADIVDLSREAGPSEPALSGLDRLMRSGTTWLAEWAERVPAESCGAERS